MGKLALFLGKEKGELWSYNALCARTKLDQIELKPGNGIS